MNLWKSPKTVEEMNDMHERTLVRHMGIVFTELGDDYVRGIMPVDVRTHQPYGLLHGGASVVLAETLGSTGAAMCVDSGQFQCVGQEINANHVRAVRSGRVIGTARPKHIGGRSQVWMIDITDESGRLICTSRLTVAVIRKGALG